MVKHEPFYFYKQLAPTVQWFKEEMAFNCLIK